MIVKARFNGPAGSGNGGYTCGLIADRLPGTDPRHGTVEVTLKVPPPLDTPLTLRAHADSAGAHDSAVPGDDYTGVYAGGELIARARPAPPVNRAVPPVPLAEATEAARDYPGFVRHPFPTCYVCGPRRAAGDGLRIFPGKLPGGRTAAPWVVPGDVSVPTVWAALDCPGGWAVIDGGTTSAASRAGGPGTFTGRPYVLGRMAATVATLPQPGDRCVVTGLCDRLDGRKAYVTTSLYAPSGALLATARATWIEVLAADLG